jgi:hypothetical protein
MDINSMDHSSGHPTFQTVGREITRLWSTPFSVQITKSRSQTGKNSPDGWGRVPDFSAEPSTPSALAVTALGLIQAAFGFDKRKNGIRMPPQHSEIAKQEADRSS